MRLHSTAEMHWRGRRETSILGHYPLLFMFILWRHAYMMRCIAQAKIFDPLAPSSQLRKTIDSQIKCKYSHYFWSSTVDFARSTNFQMRGRGLQLSLFALKRSASHPVTASRFRVNTCLIWAARASNVGFTVGPTAWRCCSVFRISASF